ncbi:MAG TPA: hypothetical protein VLA00_14765 [Xanthobacteraceae bacterium]|nr:hypothetical protein [Xanthobacteraceae bacterium]
MDLGRQLWSTYLDAHAAADAAPAVDFPSNTVLLEYVWGFLESWRDRLPIVEATPYGEAYEEEADAALTALAITGTTSSWVAASAGVWRVLFARATWAVAALTLEDAGGGVVKIPLPTGATREVRATAALLALLGGPSRDVPSVWRTRSPSEILQALPPEFPVWKQ